MKISKNIDVELYHGEIKIIYYDGTYYNHYILGYNIDTYILLNRFSYNIRSLSSIGLHVVQLEQYLLEQKISIVLTDATNLVPIDDN